MRLHFVGLKRKRKIYICTYLCAETILNGVFFFLCLFALCLPGRIFFVSVAVAKMALIKAGRDAHTNTVWMLNRNRSPTIFDTSLLPEGKTPPSRGHCTVGDICCTFRIARAITIKHYCRHYHIIITSFSACVCDVITVVSFYSENASEVMRPTAGIRWRIWWLI